MVGIKKVLFRVWEAIFTAAFFMVRVSFGILLIASFITIVIVFTVALVFILCGIGATEAADGDLGNFSADLDFDFFDWDELGTFFVWSTLAGGQTPTSPVDYFGCCLWSNQTKASSRIVLASSLVMAIRTSILMKLSGILSLS